MNCKPGDLARIVLPYADRELIGLIVTVLRLGGPTEAIWSRDGEYSTNYGPGAGWLCDAHHAGFPCFIGDEFLRPFRDPGADAVDETLQRKPVPLPTIQPELLEVQHG